ncbi:MAG: hypothetical protein CMH83_12280 [Nocardioides sp.]|nr:hypothetical protein [Nocardioides sp.]
MSVHVARRTRRRLLLLGLLLLLPALVLSGKVGLMLWHDRQGRDALAEERYADARDHFAANRTLNLVERWVAPYDEGIALYGLDEPSLAVTAFEDALVVVPPDEECRVRVNLAVAHEAVGDAYAAASPADLAAARDEWTTGREVLADGGCLVPPELAPADDSTSSDEEQDSNPDTDPDTDPESVTDARTSAPEGTRRREVRAARVVDERLADKLADVPPPDQQPEATPSPDQSSSPDPDPDDQLSQRNDRGERLRSQTERERDLVDPPDGGSDGTGEPGDAPTVSY